MGENSHEVGLDKDSLDMIWKAEATKTKQNKQSKTYPLKKKTQTQSNRIILN